MHCWKVTPGVAASALLCFQVQFRGLDAIGGNEGLLCLLPWRDPGGRKVGQPVAEGRFLRLCRICQNSIRVVVTEAREDGPPGRWNVVVLPRRNRVHARSTAARILCGLGGELPEPHEDVHHVSDGLGPGHRRHRGLRCGRVCLDFSLHRPYREGVGPDAPLVLGLLPLLLSVLGLGSAGDLLHVLPALLAQGLRNREQAPAVVAVHDALHLVEPRQAQLPRLDVLQLLEVEGLGEDVLKGPRVGLDGEPLAAGVQVRPRDHPEDGGKGGAVRSVHEHVDQPLLVAVLVELLVLVHVRCDLLVLDNLPAEQGVLGPGEPLPRLRRLLAGPGEGRDLPHLDLDEPVLARARESLGNVVALEDPGPRVNLLLPVLLLLEQPDLVPLRGDHHGLDVEAAALHPQPRAVVRVLELELEGPVVLLAHVNVVELAAPRGAVVHLHVRLHDHVDPLPVPPLAVVPRVGDPKAAAPRAVRAKAVVDVLPVSLPLHLARKVGPRDHVPGLVAMGVPAKALVRPEPDGEHVIHLAVVVPPEHVVVDPAPGKATQLPQPPAPHLVRLARERVVVVRAIARLQRRGGDVLPGLLGQLLLPGEHELRRLGRAHVRPNDREAERQSDNANDNANNAYPRPRTPRHRHQVETRPRPKLLLGQALRLRTEPLRSSQAENARAREREQGSRSPIVRSPSRVVRS
mmetsp:Transcript_1987/g.5399  ORF Transcript_1987/g.5399 Transcript_1987/m.5399 type:complete len:687 (+) Transcript_1987:57-2117(+)